MKHKFVWITAGIGMISAMVVSSIYFYKRDQEKRGTDKTNPTKLLANMTDYTKSKLFQTNLAKNDQIKTNGDKFPKITLNNMKKQVSEDK